MPTRDLGQASTQHAGVSSTHELSTRLADLARQLQQQESPQEVLDRIVARACAMVPGVQHATISRARRHQEVTSVAATSEGAAAFDDLQQQVGQGPCLDALFEHRTVRVDDLGSDERWPLLAAQAPKIGLGSTLCFQLFVRGDILGALNLLSEDTQAFTDEAEDIGLLLASHAAVAIADTEELAHVKIALDSRDLIGQAKGILMERHKITPDQAFAVLTRHSQDTNRKLREVALELTTTGALQR